MRKVVAYEFLSLDGVAEQPNKFVTDIDDAMEDALERLIAAQDAVLLGRRTYDEWAEFWPTSRVIGVIRAPDNRIARTPGLVADADGL